MKKSIFFLSLAMGLATVAMAQQPPVKTTKDFGLKGQVKKISELIVRYYEDGEETIQTPVMEFDEQGRLVYNNGCRYAYDGAGRLVSAVENYYDKMRHVVMTGGTYYSYSPEGRLLSTQTCWYHLDVDNYSRDYTLYNYDKQGILLTAEQHKVGLDKKETVEWILTCKYDKQGRLTQADRKTADKKNAKLIEGYQFLYAPDGTPKNYVWNHMSDAEYDEYGEVIAPEKMVFDTLPCHEWTFNSILYGFDYTSCKDNREYTRFDQHGNGVEWNKTDVLKTVDIVDEYGEVLAEGHDTIVFRPESRSIEYYGEYDCNISLPEMNVVYAGVKNPIKVTVSGVPEKYQLLDSWSWEPYMEEGAWLDMLKAMDAKETEDGDYELPYEVLQEEDGSYVLIPHVNQGTIRVPVVIVEEGGRAKIAGIQEFRIKKIPEPKLYIGNYPSGSVIPRDDLVKMTGISVLYSEELLFEVEPPTIGKQSVNISKVEGPENIESRGHNGKWNPEVLSYIAKAKKNSKLTIEATIQLPGGDIRTVIGSWTVGK